MVKYGCTSQTLSCMLYTIIPVKHYPYCHPGAIAIDRVVVGASHSCCAGIQSNEQEAEIRVVSFVEAFALSPCPILWCRVKSVWSNMKASRYVWISSFCLFYHFGTQFCCTDDFFDKIPQEFSLRDFPDSWKEQRSSVFVRMSCPPLSVEFYQRRRKGGFEKKICASISPAAAGGTSAKMLHFSFTTRFARSWFWEEFNSALVLSDCWCAIFLGR